MIHLVAFQDLDTGIGRTIFSDKTLQISLELIFPMISALNNFVEECTFDERGLVNASLEDIKIFLYAPQGDENPLRYVFFTDIYDNNYYLELKAINIHKHLSPYIGYEKFDAPKEVMKTIQQIIKYTQHFPANKIPKELKKDIDKRVNQIREEHGVIIADLFVGDLDQGNVFTMVHNESLKEKNSEELFAELLSAFTFLEDELWVSSPLNKNEYSKLLNHINESIKYKEGWFLRQLAGEKTDFWLVSYLYYPATKREIVLDLLYWIAQKISAVIRPYLPQRPF